ncbi:MAG: M23 family metallopeptidase [Leptospiraceae bacterium]|nr:M23 family metallopeptidase [Leptospiraceae bacterium]MDW8306564.1 M23 family metallopeptidase [Leptospiraceae bacterium]
MTKPETTIIILAAAFFMSCTTRLVRTAPPTTLRQVREKILMENQARLPRGYVFTHPEEQSFFEEDFHLDLFARRFEAGEIVYGEILPINCSRPKIEMQGQNIELAILDDRYRFFTAIHPDYEKEILPLNISCKNKYVLELFLKKKIWPESRSTLDLGSHSNVATYQKEEIQRWIEESKKLKNKAFAAKDQVYLNHKLYHPRSEHHITSAFWMKRYYERYYMKDGQKVMLKPSVSVHRGIDLRGLVGEPVYAMADGRVVLAASLYYEGNFVLLSHGHGIFTGYMHLSEILVKEGEIVRAGTLIGRCGNTGMVTASHLHVMLVVRSIPADPLGLLHLPIRP